MAIVWRITYKHAKIDKLATITSIVNSSMLSPREITESFPFGYVFILIIIIFDMNDHLSIIIDTISL